MIYKKIGTLTLNTLDKNDLNAINFLKKLCNDETIKKRFQGILVGLSKSISLDIFNRSFLVSHNEDFIGYLNVGDFNSEEKSVYLRAAVDSDKRGHSYGKTILAETTEFIFTNYPQVESIRLKIARDNRPSLMTANSCGYIWLKDDFYIKYNPYIEKNKSK